MTCTNRLVSWIWWVLKTFRIVPKNSSKCLNWTATSVWILLNLSAGAVVLRYDLADRRGDGTASISISGWVFDLGFDVVIPFQTIAGLLLVGRFVEQQRIIEDIPVPKRQIKLCLIVLFQLLFLILDLIQCILYPSVATYYMVVNNFCYVFNVLVLFTIVLTISLEVRRFCDAVDDIRNLATVENFQIIFGPLIQEYRDLNLDLQPLLLMTFTTHSVLITLFAYSVCTSSGMPNLWFSFCFISAIVHMLLELWYITDVLDDCLCSLKSTHKQLR